MDETTTNLKNQTDVIRAEIERARYEAVQSMSELQRRLSIENMRSRTRQSIRDATVGKAQIMKKKATEKSKDWGTTVYRTVRHNPIPMVMVGTGIAWLIRNKADGRDRQQSIEDYESPAYPRGYYDQPIEQAGDPDYYATRRYDEPIDETAAESFGQDRREEIKSKINEGRDRMKSAAGSLKRRASDFSDSARSRAQHIGERTRETSDRFRTRASELGHRAQVRGRRAREGFFHTLETNPLAIAGALFAVGAVVGLFAPRTQKERDVMGSTRDDLMERAKEAGREQVDKVRSVAQEAKEAAVKEAQRQDLMDRPTAEKVEEKSGSVIQRAEEKGREAADQTRDKMGHTREESISHKKS